MCPPSKKLCANNICGIQEHVIGLPVPFLVTPGPPGENFIFTGDIPLRIPKKIDDNASLGIDIGCPTLIQSVCTAKPFAVQNPDEVHGMFHFDTPTLPPRVIGSQFKGNMDVRPVKIKTVPS